MSKIIPSTPTDPLYVPSSSSKLIQLCSPQTQGRRYQSIQHQLYWWSKTYINPPKSMVELVLNKTANECVTAVVVIHDWTKAHLYILWNQLLGWTTVLTCLIYLNSDDSLGSETWFNTTIGNVNGKRKYKPLSLMSFLSYSMSYSW